MEKVVIVSGFFNPVHIGHINLFKDAKRLGDILVVIVNNDTQVKAKGSAPFMSEKERIEIIRAIKYVDEVFLSVDEDKTVRESLKEIVKNRKNCQFLFVNGGDRNENNIPEADVCKNLDIKMLDNVGGQKVQSSSGLLKNIF
jgi:cytidyltransferase-like protein